MKLFIAINLNERIKDYLMTAIHELKKAAVKGNFTHRDNLHLTLIFLGELGPDRAEAVKTVLNRIKGEPFLLSLSDFGKFKRNGGDIHWAGVDKSDTLITIQKELASDLKKEGFSLEDRAFSPHLTLGREVRLTDPAGSPYDALPASKQEMVVSRISLMKSERINGKLVYSELYGRDLG